MRTFLLNHSQNLTENTGAFSASINHHPTDGNTLLGSDLGKTCPSQLAVVEPRAGSVILRGVVSFVQEL